jgi:hypothetical protein
MASRKYVLFIGLLCLFASNLLAQETVNGYDLRDSSLIPAKRLPQHNEFLNNAYPFPAKPRNEWEIGGKIGIPTVSSDVRAVFPTGGFGLHVRKALGYVFSIRGEYDWMRAKGLNFQPSDASKDYVPQLSGYYPGNTPFFYNYKTTIHEATVQGVITLNNVRFHKAKTGFNVYGFFGFGGMTYSTFYNALNSSGQPYDFSTITGPYTYSNRKNVKKQLKSLLDGSYETMAQRDPSQPTLGGAPFKPVLVFGFGAQFKVNNKINLAVEDKYSSSKTDLIDGVQYQETSVAAQTRDYDTYNFFSVGFNYNVGKKSVEPLWWLEPIGLCLYGN